MCTEVQHFIGAAQKFWGECEQRDYSRALTQHGEGEKVDESPSLPRINYN